MNALFFLSLVLAYWRYSAVVFRFSGSGWGRLEVHLGDAEQGC